MFSFIKPHRKRKYSSAAAQKDGGKRFDTMDDQLLADVIQQAFEKQQQVNRVLRSRGSKVIIDSFGVELVDKPRIMLSISRTRDLTAFKSE